MIEKQTPTDLELVQELLDHLVCRHAAGDTNFSRSSEGRSEDRRLNQSNKHVFVMFSNKS